jgi:hypothetical protein
MPEQTKKSADSYGMKGMKGMNRTKQAANGIVLKIFFKLMAISPRNLMIYVISGD